MVPVEKQLEDYARSAVSLVWQRLATMMGATCLAAFYIDVYTSLICCTISMLCEVMEYSASKKVLKDLNSKNFDSKKLLNTVTFTSTIYTIAIIIYVVIMARNEGHTQHLGPLFFLFSAILYIAMNNCQIMRILLLRMVMFSATVIYICLYDIWVVSPPFESELWRQFGVVFFVLFFLVECCRKFVSNYAENVENLQRIRNERDRVSEALKTEANFIAIVSHELRTPLTTVKMSFDIIYPNEADSDLPCSLKNVASLGKDGATRLSFLIDDILKFQGLKNGQVELSLATIHLQKLLDSIKKSYEILGQSRNISISLEVPKTPVYVSADESLLTQVITNILANAFKFSNDNEQIKVRIETHESLVRIFVSDTGIGIPPDSEHLVFGAFHQVSSPDSRAYGGSGLGMSISKEIVSAHGGKLSYESEVGKGTTFIIEIAKNGIDETKLV